MLLLAVAVGWLVYIVMWLRDRTESRRSNSIHSFSRHLSALGHTAPIRSVAPSATVIPLRPGLAPRSAPNALSLRQARRRRRDVLTGLAATAGGSLLLAVLFGGAFTALFVLSTVGLVAYIALLVRAQQIGTERRAKVRYLPGARLADSSSVVYLESSAN